MLWFWLSSMQYGAIVGKGSTADFMVSVSVLALYSVIWLIAPVPVTAPPKQ